MSRVRSPSPAPSFQVTFCWRCTHPLSEGMLISYTMALVIRRSKIHADGVYTTAAIKKRALVAEYTGPRLTNDGADEIYEDSPRTYLFGLTDGGHVIDGDGMAAFINHSCD